MDKKLSAEFIKRQEKKLKETRTRIHLRIEELKKNDPFSDPDYTSDNAAVDTDAREQIGHQTVEAEIQEMKKRLKDIDLALDKLAKKRYGQCERCVKMIPMPRLKLIPEARYCIECESKIRK
ncbi:MAG: TraR/DksA C4-type zinc finger protein [Candidatus Roizmanbacteria bacterium]|nr:MAG: TraR/DksA C4-type zinc finger protein [Candidatus Roizmanbacteria bacterium]